MYVLVESYDGGELMMGELISAVFESRNEVGYVSFPEWKRVFSGCGFVCPMDALGGVEE